MSQIRLDCQGLACPQPVLRCKEAIETQNPATLEVIVDNDASRENVTRFLSSKGYAVATSEENGIFTLTGTTTADAGAAEENCGCEVMSPAQLAALEQKVTVFITADTIGRGDDELGGKLMVNFLATLPELGNELWRVVLVNSAVKLTTPQSPAMEHLKKLESEGATVLVCGTCLDHFGLLDKKAVGDTTNMLDVVTSMQLATKVIKV